MQGTISKNRLGKGLSAIFADEDPHAPDASGAPRLLPVAQLYPNPQQPRRHFGKEQLDELAESIKEKGVLQPLLVRPHPSKPNAYEIVAGERRWRASQLAKIHEVPVVVREIKDREALEFALIENMQRADLTPMEEAETFQHLIDEFDHSQEELAEALSKSRTYITNMLRLNTLPAEVKTMLRSGNLTAGHAKVIASAKDPLALAKEIVEGNLTVRQTETLVKKNDIVAREAKGHVTMPRVARGSLSAKNAKPHAVKPADQLQLERDISSLLGLRVSLNQKDNGSGSLTISYQTLDQFEDVLKRLTAAPSAD